MSEKRFRLMMHHVPASHRPFGSLPWDLLLEHEAQAQLNHSQSIQRLHERGGLDPHEALAVLRGYKWRDVAEFPIERVWAELAEDVAAYEKRTKPAQHVWAPLSECGELADGVRYVTFGTTGMYPEGTTRICTRANGSWHDAQNCRVEVTHVLSPHLGPIPDPTPSQQQPVPSPNPATT